MTTLVENHSLILLYVPVYLFVIMTRNGLENQKCSPNLDFFANNQTFCDDYFKRGLKNVFYAGAAHYVITVYFSFFHQVATSQIISGLLHLAVDLVMGSKTKGQGSILQNSFSAKKFSAIFYLSIEDKILSKSYR
jgi:hypothetical protein